MHEQIRQGLEDYLGGRMKSEALADYREHLGACPSCRDHVEALRAQSQMLQLLRAPSVDLAPAPGFYARVMERIEAQRPVSLWTVFMEPVFARKVMYATLALFLALGSTSLWTGEHHDALANDANPVGVLAGFGPRAQIAQGHDAAVDSAMDAVMADPAVHTLAVSN